VQKFEWKQKKNKKTGIFTKFKVFPVDEFEYTEFDDEKDQTAEFNEVLSVNAK
jgi:hypothetical protein